ncbi:MAG: hypothetical protein CVU86_03550 [Firmicutes bacterium HGW-Firmicutes-11]|nr:MAG: hypothetical protein CVU86_03550 [Firmicutes bacterium HGW-Firmicutes-11]
METQKKSKKKWILIVVLLVVAVLGGYRIMEAIKPQATAETVPINVTVGTAYIGSIYATSPLTGRIDPIASASVVPMAAGEVTAVYVSLGDQVQKGDVLFKMDNTQMATSYQQAKIAYTSASLDFERISVLYKEGAVSLQQYQGAKAQLDVSAQSLASASDAMNNYTVTSPIDGFITSVNVSTGSLASQAMPSVTIADTSQLEINTGVSEYLISRVKPGDNVDIFIKTLSEAPFTGIVKAISPAPVAGTLTYPVTISVEDPSGTVKAGMFAEVQVVSERKDDVLCIPSGAVFIKSGESRVVVLKDRIPSIITVKTGLDNGTLVEILSGLSVGDVVVTTGQQYVTDGEVVNIVGE